MIEGIFIVSVSWYLILSQEQSAGAWWLSLNENEINGKQVGTSKADCSNSMTKCACNHQPQLLYLCHGEVEVRIVNGNNYLILETLWIKHMKEIGYVVFLGSRQLLQGHTTDTVCGSASPPFSLYIQYVIIMKCFLTCMACNMIEKRTICLYCRNLQIDVFVYTILCLCFYNLVVLKFRKLDVCCVVTLTDLVSLR